MRRIEFRDPSNLKHSTRPQLNNLSDSAGRLNTQIQTLVSNHHAFRGQAATAMGAYLTEVHGTILTAWQNCFAYYRNITEKYVRDLNGVDESQDAIINIDYLEDFVQESVIVVQAFNELEDIVSTFFSTYSEFLGGVHQPQAEPVASHLANAQKLAMEQAQAMDKHDNNYRDAMYTVDELLYHIKKAFNTYRIGDGAVNYNPGDFPNGESGAFDNINRMSEVMINNMVERLLPGGEMDTFAVGNIIAMGHETGLSELELQVLLNLFALDGVGLDGIVEAYGMASLIMLVTQNPESMRLNGIYTDADLRDHIEMLSRDGTFAGTLTTVENRALEQLADALRQLVINEANSLVIRGGPITETDLNNLDPILQQALLLAFLNDIGLGAPTASFNLSNFDGRTGGRITFWSNPYIVSGIHGLVNDRYANDRLRNELAVDIQRNLGQYSPGLSSLLRYAVISGLGYASKPISIANTGVNIASYIIQMIINNGADLSPQEIEHYYRMLALSISDLGGGVASIDVPGGYHVMWSTLATPAAVINVALLESHGISLEEALAGLREPQGSELQNRIVDIIAVGSEERYAFEAPLRNLLYENIAHINREFGLNLADDTPLGNLPQNVLEYLIDLSRGNS